MRSKYLPFAVPLAAALLIAGCSGSSKPTAARTATAGSAKASTVAHAKGKTRKGPPGTTYVSKAQLGGDWPFIGGVTAGWLGCDKDHPGAMTFTPAGTGRRTFGLNGTALDAGWPQFPKRIWARDGSTSLDGLQAKDQKCT
jgi:hypothetical protein